MQFGAKSWKTKLNDFLCSEKPAIILLLFVLAERMIYTLVFGNSIFATSDSYNYYESGIVFAQTGHITYQGYITALIMPGVTVLVGALAKIFGDGAALINSLEFVWSIMGVITPYFMYKAASVYVPKPFSCLVIMPYLLPAYMEISVYLMTEGPFYMFFAMALYYLFMAAEKRDTKYVVLLGFSILGAMMFRANILMFAGFSLAYLVLVKKFTWKELLAKVAIVTAILMIFIVPWTIRNYIHFEDFIPVTYGMGNPVCEGTYFGDYCQVDDKIDMSIPEEMFKEQYADYYDGNGQIKNPDLGEYLLHMKTGIAADYRIAQWLKLDPINFLKTYLIVKPRIILNWCWYDVEMMGISYELAGMLRKLNCLLCVAAIPLCFICSKLKKQILFLTGAYGISLLSVAYALPINRYAESAVPYRFIMASMTVYLLWELYKKLKLRNIE